MTAANTADLREALAQPSPRAIKAAWEAWRARHGGNLGPGPAFTEGLAAGMAVDHADLTARLAQAEGERDKAREAMERLSFTDHRGAVWRPVPAWTYFSLHEEKSTAHAELTRLRAEVARLQERVVALQTEDVDEKCPFAGPPKTWAHIGVNDPCPVCGDLGTLAEADKPSSCPDMQRPRSARAALKPQGGEHAQS